MKISACVITKNEAKNIARCLASYRDIVDEIILVDTGSTDSTVEIARNFGAKIYHYKWNHDFAAAKNFALSKARGKWIVFLDADEYLDEAAAKNLPEILKNIDDKTYNAVGCKLINLDADKQNKIIESFMKVRVFKNSKHIRYWGNIHETIRSKKGKINILEFGDKIRIYHTGYSTHLVKSKGERNLKILWGNIRKNGENPIYYRYLADCYLAIGEYDQCIKYSRLQIQSAISIHKGKAYKNIIDALTLKKAPQAEIEVEIKQAIQEFSDQANFYYVYGGFLLKQRRYEQALQNLLKAASFTEHSASDINFATGKMSTVYIEIGLLYQLKNQEETAFPYFLKALQQEKYNVVAFQSMLGTMIMKDSTQTIGTLSTIYHESCETDVAFLVKQLKYSTLRTLYDYYVTIWCTMVGEDKDSLAVGVMAKGDYEAAFRVFYKEMIQERGGREKGILAAVAAIAGEKKEWMTQIIVGSNDPALQIILRRYCGTFGEWSPEAWDVYLQLLLKLALFYKAEVLERYLSIVREASPAFLFKTALALITNHRYELSIRVFQEYFEKCKSVGERGATDVYINLGYCHYKLREYDAAYQYFIGAVARGYTNQDVYEFMRWIEQLGYGSAMTATAVPNDRPGVSAIDIGPQMTILLRNVENAIDASNNLQALLAIILKNRVAAQTIIECIMTKTTKKRLLLNIIGVELYKRHLPKEALLLLEAAYKLESQDSRTVYNIAYIIGDIGDKQTALFFLQSLAQKSERVTALIQTLEAGEHH